MRIMAQADVALRTRMRRRKGMHPLRTVLTVALLFTSLFNAACSAQGPLPYKTEVAFNMEFDQPLAIVSPPGETNRLFIIEKPGRIVVISDLANPKRSTFL